jgi:hypothetical protein
VRDAKVYDRRGGTYFDSGRHEAVYDATMRGIAEGITFEQALMESLRVQHAVETAFLPGLGVFAVCTTVPAGQPLLARRDRCQSRTRAMPSRHRARQAEAF